MPQTRESGAEARQFGYGMARRVANTLGANIIAPNKSNEARWDNRRIIIKSAHFGVPEIGVTEASLARVAAIVAALQDKDRIYTLYEVSPEWFRLQMQPSRSSPHVMMVHCINIRADGKKLGRIARSKA